MRKKALLLLSSTMFAALSSTLPSAGAVGQSTLSDIVPIGQALQAAPGEQMVIEDFTVSSGTSYNTAATNVAVNTADYQIGGYRATQPGLQVVQVARTAPSVSAQRVITQVVPMAQARTAPVQMVQVAPQIPSNILELQSKIQTVQPQDAAPAVGSNSYFYFTQPDTVYGAPIAAPQPVYQPAPQPVPQPLPQPAPQPTVRSIVAPVVPPMPTILPSAPSRFTHYAGLKGSYSVPSDVEYGGTATAPLVAASQDGMSVLVNAGRRFGVTGTGSSLRGEVELGHRSYGLESFDGVAAHEGKTSVDSAMVNLYAEVGGGDLMRIRPYIGIGGGVGQVRHSEHTVLPTGLVLDHRDTGTAAQGMLGFAVSMGSNIDLNMEGRHFRLMDVERTDVNNITHKDDFEANEIGLGLQFNF